MNDIVERLRQKERDYYHRDTGGAFGMGPVLREAADEIESLRARLADWHKVADDRSAEIIRLEGRLAEVEADNARLVAANKARDEFLRGHRYKHSEVDGYIDLCESQMADLKAQLAEARDELAQWRATGLIDARISASRKNERE